MSGRRHSLAIASGDHFASEITAGMFAMRNMFERLSDLSVRGAGLFSKRARMAVSDGRRYQSESARDALGEKFKHRIPQWNAEALVLDTWSTAPDSPQGREFLQRIDADTLHVLALGLNWQNPSTMEWLKALAVHPACDKATAWALFLTAGSGHYEAVIREAGARPDFQLTDADRVSLLDILHGRFLAHDFATNEIALEDGLDVDGYRRFQETAEETGQSLHWALPDYAFALCKGRKPCPKFEVWEAEKIMVPFRKWLKENPDRHASQAGKPSVRNRWHQR
jgi:hypothetical protein